MADGAVAEGEGETGGAGVVLVFGVRGALGCGRVGERPGGKDEGFGRGGGGGGGGG